MPHSQISLRNSKLRSWNKVFNPIFHDNCNVARKYVTKDTQTALFPVNKMSLMSCREHITKPYFSLFDHNVAETSTNYWMEDSMHQIIENGNHNHLIDNSISRAIGDENLVMMNERVSDETRLREFIARQISGIGTVPKKVQATFCMGAAIILAENIVSPATWREIGPKICNEMGWSTKVTTKYKYLAASIGRRFGKTRFVSMTVVNYALSKPGSTIIVFSTSQDASDLLRVDVENMMAEAGEVEFAGRMWKLTDLKGRGHKKMQLRSPYDHSKISTIYFKPGLHKHNMDKQVCIFSIYFKKRTIRSRYVFLYSIFSGLFEARDEISMKVFSAIKDSVLQLLFCFLLCLVSVFVFLQ